MRLAGSGVSTAKQEFSSAWPKSGQLPVLQKNARDAGELRGVVRHQRTARRTRDGCNLHVIRTDGRALRFEVMSNLRENLGSRQVKREANVWREQRVELGSILDRLRAFQTAGVQFRGCHGANAQI